MKKEQVYVDPSDDPDETLAQASGEPPADNDHRTGAWLRTVTCPHCDGKFRIGMDIIVTHTLLLDEQPKRQEKQLTPREVQLLEMARASGTLDAFVQVVREVKIGQLPGDLDRFFVTWLRCMEPTIIHRAALDRLCGAFKVTERDVECYSAQGISMLMVDGNVRAFFPTILLKAFRRHSRQHAAAAVASGRPLEALEGWLRTRFGFVAGRGLLFDELRQHSVGDFARTIAKTV